jgi:diguanylate cyclase (GGDEF)-like protein
MQGTVGSTGKRPRVGRPRSPDPSSGPLPRVPISTTSVPEQAINADPSNPTGSRLMLDAGPKPTRDRRLATLDAALARLASSGPTPVDVLEVLVRNAATLLDAPTRLAVVSGYRLVWATACADPNTPIGTEVQVDQTACGAAWLTGLIQHVAAPARPAALAGASSPDESGPMDFGSGEFGSVEANQSLSTRCCGSPAGLLAVPLLRQSPNVAGRHADPMREVIAVLALSADRPGWFDDADIEATADLAEVAGERIAELTREYEAFQVNSAKQLTGLSNKQLTVGEQPLAITEQAVPMTESPLQMAEQAAATAEQSRADSRPPSSFAGWFVPVTRPTSSTRTGSTSRVPRARGRQSGGGSALPPAMPAPDSMGLWQWDATSGACTWSSPVARLIGLDPDAELTLELVREAVLPADRGRFDIAVRAISTGHGVAGALRLRTRAGRAKHAYAWSEVRRDAAGGLLGAWGAVVDVTAFEHDATALRTGLAGLRAAQELTGLATWEWRPDSGRLIWSDEMYRLVGVGAETFEPTPARWHCFIHPDDLERARRLDLDAGGHNEQVATFRLIGPGGEIRHVQSWSATSRAVDAADGVGTAARPTVYGATIDVTRQVHDRMMLEQLSATDPVTGLGNRLAYDRRIQELLNASAAAGPAHAVTLILLDLDRFKVVNESLGHQIGDRLLIEVARRLVAVVPEDSVTARMGGDEFVVVPPVGASETDIRRLAIGIVDALRAPYVLPETGELVVCPASLGVAMSAGRRMSGHDLLREADIALYRAKDSGRDRFVIFDEALKDRTRVRRSAERRLREALEQDLLVMEYQPVVDFVNGRIVGAEGLVRLQNAEEGERLVGPDLFLDIAEQTGLVVELDSWVIETAIRQLGQWSQRAAGLADPPWLAINLSARSMENPRVVRRLIDAVKSRQVPRGRIKVELSEHSFVGTLPAAEASLRQLLANGIHVGIDDFGTGYSALAYLQNFHLDFMKIDRAFVASVGEGQRGDAVVTAIVDLAHAHGMRVIAEGVESGRQARRLREMGCDFAQGFHFGRPGEAARIVRG